MQQSMEKWKIELTSCDKALGEVSIKKWEFFRTIAYQHFYLSCI